MPLVILIIINLFFPIIALGYLISFFISPRKKLLKNLRYELPERFGFYKTKISENSIWLHAASVGEVKSVKKLARFLENIYPDNPLVITTSTDAGRKTAKKLICKNSFLAPLDFYPLTYKFIKKIKPLKLFIAESEIWPNMFTICKMCKIPIFIINGRISIKSAKLYGFLKPFTKYLFKAVEIACTQTSDISKRYEYLGMDKNKIFVTGNTKYDLLDPNPEKTTSAKDFITALGWADCPVLVCGSTHLPEENIIIKTFAKLAKETNFKLILAPRHLERLPEIKQNLKSEKINFATLKETPKNASCILVDELGCLTAFYNIATICFVGGTLVNKGGHNLLEPAILKKPIIFGKYTHNSCEEAKELTRTKGALLVDENNLEQTLTMLSKNPDLMTQMGQNAYKTAYGFMGATSRITEIIKNHQ